MLILLLNKLKSFLLVFLNLFNRILCCFRRRRRSCSEAITLTHVVSENSSENGLKDTQTWDWEDENEAPKTIQDHINLYRKQKSINQLEMEQNQEENLNFFDDMAPKITKQTKVLIGNDCNENATRTSRLSFNPGGVVNSELGEWEENAGWEAETMDWAAQQALREKKRQEREKKIWEQQQKRQEKLNKSLGSRIST